MKKIKLFEEFEYPEKNDTVRLYRIENLNIPYDDRREGDVSKKEIIGCWFTDRENVLSFLKKNQRQEGATLVYVDINREDLDKYHVINSPYTKGLDVEPDNYIIPHDVKRNYVDLKDITKSTNFFTTKKAQSELSDIIDNLPK